MTLAQVQARAGVLDEVRVTVAAIADDATQDMTKQLLTDAQAKSGDLAGATATTATINNRNIQANALHSIAVAQLRWGDLAGAKATTASASLNVYEEAVTLERVSAEVRASKLNEAQALVETLAPSRPRGLGLLSLAKDLPTAANLCGPTTLEESRTTDSPRHTCMWCRQQGGME